MDQVQNDQKSGEKTVDAHKSGHSFFERHPWVLYLAAVTLLAVVVAVVGDATRAG